MRWMEYWWLRGNIAERMCAAIDGQEKAEHFQRLLQEYNEWLINQQRQQAMVQESMRSTVGEG